MSRRELARRSGLNINTVCKLANDDKRIIDLETLNQICAVMEIKPGDILTWVPDG
jgi:DNA-binding Xre family transcriptional regulator